MPTDQPPAVTEAHRREAREIAFRILPGYGLTPEEKRSNEDGATEAIAQALAAAVAAERAKREAAEVRYQEQHDIVARIWRQLGSPTYEELAGLSIYDLIDELQVRARAQKAGGE